MLNAHKEKGEEYLILLLLSSGLLTTSLLTHLACPLALSLILLPRKMSRATNLLTLMAEGVVGTGRQRAHGRFAAVGAYSGAEAPFHCFFDGVVEEVGEEGDHGETELGEVSFVLEVVG
jgi:hypothetical protein